VVPKLAGTDSRGLRQFLAFLGSESRQKTEFGEGLGEKERRE